MKKLFVFTLLVIFSLGLVACKKKDPYVDIPTDQSGSLDILLWNGDGVEHKDIGSKNWKPEEIRGQNVAAIYAVAKEFKKQYPNIQINVLARIDGPEATPANGMIKFEQELKNFYERNNKYPDIWTTDNLVRDLVGGLVMDLSMFSNDPLYQSMNESLLSMTNYFGFQAALPQYSLPWGVYVNKSLAEKHNIRVPSYDWTWEQYSDFVSKADVTEDYYGEYDTGMPIIRRALIESQLEMAGKKNTYVNLQDAAFKKAITQLPKISKTAISTLYGSGDLLEADMVRLGNWYSPKAFTDGKLLTLHNGPWHIGDLFEDGGYFEVQAKDWDIYPLPSFNGKGKNTVAAVLDPVVVYNYCALDGNKVCSDAELQRAQIAYKFTSFWTASTESVRARVEQKFNSAALPKEGETAAVTLRTAMNDSFPIVTGTAFDEQMTIWYEMENHVPYADAKRFPGFDYVIRLWRDGKITSVSDKAFPLTYKDGDQTIDCLEYVNGYWDPEVVGGVTMADDNWADTYIAALSDWNKITNDRFAVAFKQVEDAIKKHYDRS